MKLAPRLVLLGVGVPMVGMLASVAIAGSLFRGSLVEDVDRHLVAQAAVESVSLFDGPEGAPHLHVKRTQMTGNLPAFGANTTILGPAGDVVVTTAPGQRVPVVTLATTPGIPTLGNPTPQVRTLTMGVLRPGVGIYTLYMSASLEPIDATMSAFYRTVVGTTVGIGLLLLVLSLLQTRALVRRVEALIRFVPVIRSLEAPPPKDSGTPPADELATLEVSLQEAALDLHHIRLAQERFLANAAHQLRTPLAVLRTEIDLALRRPRDVDELRNALSMARNESDRLTLLARRLLDFESFRTDHIALETVSLQTLVSEVVGRFALQTSKNDVTIEVKAETPVEAECDPWLIAQALENLVDNAVRFSPPGGSVDVRLFCSESTCTIEVCDQGTGIPETDPAKLFEPFVRGTDPKSQTGLGLAIVDDIMRRHGGTATLHPSDTGTVARVTLPRAAT